MKKRVKKIIAMSLALALLSGQTAFATETGEEQKLPTVQQEVQEETPSDSVITKPGDANGAAITDPADSAVSKPEESDSAKNQETEDVTKGEENPTNTDDAAQTEEGLLTEEPQIFALTQSSETKTIQTYLDYVMCTTIDYVTGDQGDLDFAIVPADSSSAEICTVDITDTRYLYAENSRYVTGFFIRSKSVGTATYNYVLNTTNDQGANEQVIISTIEISVGENHPSGIVDFPDENVKKMIFTNPYVANYNSYVDENQDGFMSEEEILTLTSITIQPEMKDLTGLEKAVNVSSIQIASDSITDYSFFDHYPNLNSISVKDAVTLTAASESSLVDKLLLLTKDRTECLSFMYMNISGAAYAKLMLQNKDIQIEKGTIIHVTSDKISMPHYEGTESASVSVGDETILGVSGELVIGRKVGNTTATLSYKGVNTTVNVEVTGIDENIALETSTGTTTFNPSNFNVVTVYRENNTLWEVYPEEKKIAENVKKYVSDMVYELGTSTNLCVVDYALDEDGSLWDLNGKIADNVQDYDNHYILEKDGTFRDIYTDSMDMKDVLSWGRNSRLSKTYVLKSDHTLWMRDDVAKGQTTNPYTQIAADAKSLAATGENMRIVYGYINQNNQYISLDGSQTIDGVISANQYGLWTESGYYYLNRGSRVETLVKLSSTVQLTDISPEQGWDNNTGKHVMGIVDENGNIYKVLYTEEYSENGSIFTYEEPVLLSDQFDRFLSGDESPTDADYVTKDGKYYDLFGNEIENIKDGAFEIMDGTLYKYGVPILTNTTSYFYNNPKMFAIRTDGTVWDVTGQPKILVKFEAVKEPETNPPVITSIDLDANGNSLNVGDTITLKVSAQDENDIKSGLASFHEMGNTENSFPLMLQYNETSKLWEGTCDVADVMNNKSWVLDYVQMTDEFDNQTKEVNETLYFSVGSVQTATVQAIYDVLDKNDKWVTSVEDITVPNGVSDEFALEQINANAPNTSNGNYEFDSWVYANVNNSESQTVSDFKVFVMKASYKDVKVIDMLFRYYSQYRAGMQTEYVPHVMKNGETYEEAIANIETKKMVDMNDKLDFVKWVEDTYATEDYGVETEGYKAAFFDAECNNRIIQYILDDKFKDTSNASDYMYGDLRKYGYSTTVVVDETATLELPTEINGYKEITWVKADPSITSSPTAGSQLMLSCTAVYGYAGSREEALSDTSVQEVKEEINNAAEGTEVKVDMGSATIVDQTILETAKGKDVDIVVDMGNYSWTISGNTIQADSLSSIDLGVTKSTDTIPDDVMNQVTGNGEEAVQLSLTHNGEFGFTGELTIFVGEQYSGKAADVYHNNNGTMVLTDSTVVDENGYVKATFTHASDYAVVFKENIMKGDANGDGKVTIKDAVAILRTIVDESKDMQNSAMDMNEDGKITIADAVLLLRMIVANS